MTWYRSDDSTVPFLTKTIVWPDTSVAFNGLYSYAKDHTGYSYVLRERTVNGYFPACFCGAPPTPTQSDTYNYTITNTPTKLVISKHAAGHRRGAARRASGAGEGRRRRLYRRRRCGGNGFPGSDGTNSDGTYKPHTLVCKLNVNTQYTLLETQPPVGYCKSSQPDLHLS